MQCKTKVFRHRHSQLGVTRVELVTNRICRTLSQLKLLALHNLGRAIGPSASLLSNGDGLLSAAAQG